MTDDEMIRQMAQRMSDLSGECITAGDVKKLLHDFVSATEKAVIEGVSLGIEPGKLAGLLNYEVHEVREYEFTEPRDERREQKRRWRKEVWGKR